MMERCFLTDLTCKGVACEGIYHESTQQCKVVMVINRYLGHIDGPAPIAQPTPQSPLVADALKVQPDMSQLEWMVKGNQPAPSTAPFAYAFAFKYQTEELRPEAEELYAYLLANEKLVIGEFTYTISGKGKNLFARNKAKT